MGSFPETCNAVVSWFCGREQSPDDVIKRIEETLMISIPRLKIEPTIVFATPTTIPLFLDIIQIFLKKLCGLKFFGTLT